MRTTKEGHGGKGLERMGEEEESGRKMREKEEEEVGGGILWM